MAVKKVVILFKILVLMVSHSFSILASNCDSYYATYEGFVSMSSNEQRAHILTYDGQIVLLGPLGVSCLKGVDIIVTGEVLTGAGLMLVQNYSIMGEESEYIIGTLKNSHNKLILIGDDQIIYEILGDYDITPHIEGTVSRSLREYDNRRVLITGELELSDDFTGKIKFSGYCIDLTAF